MSLSVAEAQRELQELAERLEELERLEERCARLERFIALGRALEGDDSPASGDGKRPAVPPITIA